MSYDRGSFPRSITFTRCERGFIFSIYDLNRDMREVWAFDKIEDAAAWLVEQYTPIAPENGPGPPQ